MLITCKCLNITVEYKETDSKNAELGSLTLAPVGELENFFKEDVKEVEIVSVSKQIATLTQERAAGEWIVEHCLNCSVNCYATNSKTSGALINIALITSTDAINHMKKHRDFSPVFKVIIQPVAEERKDKFSAGQHTGKIQGVLTSIQQQLRDSIRQEVTKTEENIRIYSEQQYILLEEFRSRANKDHKALVSKINEVQVPVENPIAIFSNDIEKENRRAENEKSALSRHVISNKKSHPKKVLQENENRKYRVQNRSISSYSKSSEKIKGSLDSEGLFVLEGMEDAMSLEPFHSEGESDTDLDDSESHDEGIDVHSKLPSSIQLARSLPVNVPVYSMTVSDFEIDKEPTDAVDIAASIKALARSVHGDTVFGDLPRPRFSTQI